MSTISSGTTSTTALVNTADTTGNLTLTPVSGVVTVSSTGALTVPVGTTGQRPTPANGMLRVNTTTNVLEIYSSSTSNWKTVLSLAAAPPSNIEVLIVAGGGSGGDSAAFNGRTAGGGAGGLLYYGAETPKSPNGSALSVTAGTTYTITVGAGSSQVRNATYSGTGSNSAFDSYAATGGGGGGYNDGVNGGAGGSGGGATYAGTTTGTATAGQGNIGGITELSPNYGAGGGGGAGAVGGNGTTTVGGAGGNGLAYVIGGSSAYYAGGGSGDVWRGITGSTSPGAAGLGGGGVGNGFLGSGLGGAGTANTGGGGGANGYGGSGVVILRYADTFDAAASTTGSPTVTVAGGYRVYRFTGSGSITF